MGFSPFFLPENGEAAVRASENRRRRVSGGPGLREDDDAVQNDEAMMTVRSVSTGAPCCGVEVRTEVLRAPACFGSGPRRRLAAREK